MEKVHYLAAWTDSGLFFVCDHEHQTVASAVACISVAGGYVVAFETEQRELNDREMAEFQRAMFGTSSELQIDKVPNRPLGWLPAK
jgi:hypothetical protein